MATIVLKKKKLSFLERIYIVEIGRGLMITLRHLLKNIVAPSKMMTYQWPDQTKPIADVHRSEHRLMLRPDDSIRCTACMLCATACPAKCIHIEAQEGDIPEKEKFPQKFTIDLLRCIYCGYCVDACPCDAIRMDTNKPVKAYENRIDFVKDINYLKQNHPEGKSPYSIGVY